MSRRADQVVDVLGLVVRPAALPLAWALAAPAAVLDATSAAARTAVLAQQVVAQAAQALPGLVRLTARVDQLLDAVEPPVLRVLGQLDEEALDELVRAARTAPTLVAAMHAAVAGFDVFLARADAVRDAAADVTERAGRLNDEVAALVAAVARLVDTAGTTAAAVEATTDRAERVAGEVEALAARAARTATAAQDVVDGGRAALDRASGLVTDATGVLGGAEQTVLRADEVVGTVEGLAERVRPVVEASLDLAEQALPAARTLLDATGHLAPAAADLAPDLVAALIELTKRLPELLHRLDTQLLPTLEEFQRTPRDVRALKDSVEEMEPTLGQVAAELAGLPGAQLLRRRGRRLEPAPRRALGPGEEDGRPRA